MADATCATRGFVKTRQTTSTNHALLSSWLRHLAPTLLATTRHSRQTALHQQPPSSIPRGGVEQAESDERPWEEAAKLQNHAGGKTTECHDRAVRIWMGRAALHYHIKVEATEDTTDA